MKDEEYARLYSACRKLEDGPDYSESSYALNLLITALDFQMNVVAVNNATAHYIDNFGFTSHRGLNGIVRSFPNSDEGNRQLALALWSNNMWTRAEFLRLLLINFEMRGVTGRSSLARWAHTANFEQDVRGQFRSAHHSMGLAVFSWLCLRCGVDTIKPDVHVLKFVSNCIGRSASAVE